MYKRDSAPAIGTAPIKGAVQRGAVPFLLYSKLVLDIGYLLFGFYLIFVICDLFIKGTLSLLQICSIIFAVNLSIFKFV